MGECFAAYHDNKTLAPMGVNVGQRVAKPVNGAFGGMRMGHGMLRWYFDEFYHKIRQNLPNYHYSYSSSFIFF